MLCARICMRARSSVCAREGGEVHKNREAQKNKEVHKNKNGPEVKIPGRFYNTD